MLKIFLTIFLLFAGCGFSELNEAKVKKMVKGYFTPYSSTKIATPLFIDVIYLKKLSDKKAVAKVCYQFRFEKDYEELVEYVKSHPHSFLARFDAGLIALLGRKFGNFRKNEIKSRCDLVEFEKKYNSWVISRI